MKRYEVQTVSAIPTDWSEIETLGVDTYLWREGYEPKVTAAVVLVEGKGFAMHMECEESNPRVTCYDFGSPVWQDSCMECFIDFAPEKTVAYMNMESNAAGTLCCNFGESRKNRKPVAKMNIACPTVKAEIFDGRWTCDFFVPLGTIKALYGKDSFKKGDIVRANFYKCGDKTEIEHYGCWNRVESDKPEFHFPSSFGELIIK